MEEGEKRGWSKLAALRSVYTHWPTATSMQLNTYIFSITASWSYRVLGQRWQASHRAHASICTGLYVHGSIGTSLLYSTLRRMNSP